MLYTQGNPSTYLFYRQNTVIFGHVPFFIDYIELKILFYG